MALCRLDPLFPALLPCLIVSLQELAIALPQGHDERRLLEELIELGSGVGFQVFDRGCAELNQGSAVDAVCELAVEPHQLRVRLIELA